MQFVVPTRTKDDEIRSSDGGRPFLGASLEIPGTGYPQPHAHKLSPSPPTHIMDEFLLTDIIMDEFCVADIIMDEFSYLDIIVDEFLLTDILVNEFSYLDISAHLVKYPHLW